MSIKVFTCANNNTRNQATILIRSLQITMEQFNEDYEIYLFHDGNVNLSPLYGINVNFIELDYPDNRPLQEYLIFVLSCIVERKFGDNLLFVDPRSLVQGELKDITTCPLTDDIWLSARNRYAGWNDRAIVQDKDGKDVMGEYRYRDCYPHYASDWKRLKAVNPNGYFDTAVMYIKRSGLEKAIKKEGYDTLFEFFKNEIKAKGMCAEDCLNRLIHNTLILPHRFNASSEDIFKLDFGDKIAFRDRASKASIIHFRHEGAPWTPVPETGIPEDISSQVPYNIYASAVKYNNVYVNGWFYLAVMKRERADKLTATWHTQLRPLSRELKRKNKNITEDFHNMHILAHKLKPVKDT